MTLPARTGCTSYVTTKSNGTIPAGRANPNDSARYSVIETPSNASIISFNKNSCYWKFTGIIFQTSSSSYAANKNVISPLIWTDTTGGITERPHHLVFDQVICRPYEAVVPHLNRTAQQCYQTEGHDVQWTNSYVYGFGGVTNDIAQAPKFNISAVTADSTPTATSTQHGLGTGNSYSAAIEGGTGNWSRINGMTRITTVEGNTFTLKKRIGLVRVVSNTATVYMAYYDQSNLQTGDSITISGYSTFKAFNGTYTVGIVGTSPNTAPYFTIRTSGVPDGNYCWSGWKVCGNYEDNAYLIPNMTNAGALTGTLYARVQTGDWSQNSFCFLNIAGVGPTYYYNNFTQCQFSSLFTGGGGAGSNNTATLTAASAGQATFSNLGALQVGDLLAVQVTGNPTMGEGCQWRLGSAACLYYQAAKVLTINAETKVVTWEGYGNQPLVSGKSGTLSVSGTIATWVSGDAWGNPQGATGYQTGLPIHIGSSDYRIYSHDSSTQLRLETAPVNGTYTWTMNLVADVPGGVAWDGEQPNQIYWRRNTIDKDASISYGAPCKAASEFKNNSTTLMEGTHFTGTECVTFGEPTYNQGGNTPWARKVGNVERGGLVDFSERISAIQGDDPYRTAIVNYDGLEKTGSQNNLWTDYLFLNASSWDVPLGIGGYDPRSKVQHLGLVFSAATTAQGQTPGEFGSTNGCNLALTPPFGMTQLLIQNNIFPYGSAGFADSGKCMRAPNPAGQITHNTFFDNRSVGRRAILAAFPTGTKYAASQAAIGYHTGCDGTVKNWRNCYLDDSSASRAAATDGRDIGPDIKLIDDLINDYSCVAGLCDQLTGARNNKAFSIGSTTTSITFTIQGTVAVDCTLKLYTDPARLRLAPDTNTRAKQACDRSGNTVVGKQVTFALGSNNALSANTPYYYDIEVSGSGEVMVGSFTTSGASGGK